MKILPASKHDLENVVTWVSTRDACLRWAGPKVTYPVVHQLLQEEIAYSQRNSFVGVNGNGVVAFGQLLEINKDGYHIARVIVKPSQQGIGCGGILCTYLIEHARELSGKQVTLKVFRDNHTAVSLYGKLGFQVAEKDSTADVLQMVKSLTRH